MRRLPRGISCENFSYSLDLEWIQLRQSSFVRSGDLSGFRATMLHRSAERKAERARTLRSNAILGNDRAARWALADFRAWLRRSSRGKSADGRPIRRNAQNGLHPCLVIM